MDKEIADKMYMAVGKIEALNAIALQTYGMPSDSTTAALIDAIRALTNKAVLSAWRYADEQTKAK
jgi:hypothetical protein